MYMSTMLTLRLIVEDTGVVLLESKPTVLAAWKRIRFFSEFQFKAKRGGFRTIEEARKQQRVRARLN